MERRNLQLILLSLLITYVSISRACSDNVKPMRILDKEIYGQILKTSNSSNGTNVLFSPYGIMSVLKPMISMLSKGKQLVAMKRLGISRLGDLRCSLGLEGNDEEFREASRIWLDEEVEMDKSISEGTRVLIKKIPMVHHSESALKSINEWVSKHTMGMIRDLLNPDSLLDGTKLVVTNALAFHGKWKYPFKVEHTELRDFKLNKNEKTRVLTMATEMKTRFYRGAEGEIAELPYAGDRFSMFIVIPTDSLSHDNLEEIVRHKMKKHLKLQVFLPKFKLTSEHQLRRLLRDIGLESLFSHVGAIKNENISFTDVLHKVALVVNEEGTEASAGSAGVTSRSFPMRFRVDRPFEFLIRDLATHQTIFHGKIEKPE